MLACSNIHMQIHTDIRTRTGIHIHISPSLMYVYTCIHVCMHIYIHRYMHIIEPMQVCVYIYIQTQTKPQRHTHACAHTNMHLDTSTYAENMQRRTYMSMCIYIYTRTQNAYTQPKILFHSCSTHKHTRRKCTKRLPNVMGGRKGVGCTI